MKPRTLIVLGVIEMSLLLTAIYFDPSYSVRGRLHGEAFFEGKSTSWWRQELDRWDVKTKKFRLRGGRDWCASERPVYFRVYSRESSWFERQWQRWAPARERADAALVQEWLESSNGPRLLRGNAEARAVLTELLDDDSPKIRLFARIGLGIEPPPGEE